MTDSTAAARSTDTTAVDASALDADLAALSAAESRWADTSLAQRADLLAEVHGCVAAAAEQWVQTATTIKGLAARSPLVGEEWMSGPYAMLTATTELAATLRALADRRSPLEDLSCGSAPGRRVAVRVLPAAVSDRLLLSGFRADVWMRPGVAESTVRTRAGAAARFAPRTGGIGLVLGAGNITSIPPLDVLTELFERNRVVILKLNPVMDAMLAPYRVAFAPLIDRGVLKIVVGGGEVGSLLAHHPQVTHVHITGSAHTHDLVVFGAGADGARRKAAGDPLLDKPITSELGGVSPVIVVPGQWTERDLVFQAEHIATMRLHNGGYNCIAGQVVLISEAWPQKQAFLTELAAAMDRTPERRAWYPGSDDRMALAVREYPAARTLGGGARLLVESAEEHEQFERTEYFAPVLGVTELPGTGQTFLEAAVAHANSALAGTLGANIVCDPRTLRTLGSGFEEALVGLQYGTIGVNAWTGFGFLTTRAPWGAFPGHRVTDVQSGIGSVHNTFLLEDPQRTVIRGPFRPFPRSLAGRELSLFPKPPWFVTARTAASTGRALTRYAAKPSLLRMIPVFASAFRG